MQNMTNQSQRPPDTTKEVTVFTLNVILHAVPYVLFLKSKKGQSSSHIFCKTLLIYIHMSKIYISTIAFKSSN